MADDKAKKKNKRPTAEKRMIQNEKRRKQNKILKSKIRTSIRRFEESLKSGEQDKVQERLSLVYGIVDKAVKQGIFKLNKASRIKSRLTAKAAQQA